MEGDKLDFLLLFIVLMYTGGIIGTSSICFLWVIELNHLLIVQMVLLEKRVKQFIFAKLDLISLFFFQVLLSNLCLLY